MSIDPGFAPYEWVRLQMSGIAPSGDEFVTFCQSLDIDPNKANFEAIEVYRMVIEAMARSDDAHYGLCDTRLPLGTWEIALRIMSTASTLREALDLYVAFCEVTSPNNRPSYQADGNKVIFRLDINSKDHDRTGAAEITNIIIRYSGMCWLVGKFIPVEKLVTRSPLYARLLTYCPDLKCPVELGTFTGIVFERGILSLPRQPGLAADVLSDSIRWISLIDKMRSVMAKQNLPIMSAETIQRNVERNAKRRNVDERQKRRMALDLAGFNLRELDKSTKAYKAMMMLSTTNMTTIEIAEQLGFSDERAFRRFFQSATNLSPSAYRDEVSWKGDSQASTVFSDFRRAIKSVSHDAPGPPSLAEQ